MGRTFRRCRRSSPSPALQAAAGEIGEVLAQEGLVPAPERAMLGRVVGELATWDLYDLQERYVSLFDRSRSLSLNLFEHLHGESRDRNGAMVDLLETYRAGGFDLAEAREVGMIRGRARL